MSPKQLLAYFDRIAEAPGAVSRLRRFILDLAVRGKLVEQDPSDEPAPPFPSGSASGLAHNEGDIGVTNNRKGASESNGFQLPSRLDWADLQSIVPVGNRWRHLPPPKTDTGIPFLVIGNIRARRLDFNQCRYVSEHTPRWIRRRQPKRGDVLYTLVGSFGIPVIVTDDRLFCVQRHIGILRPSPSASTCDTSHLTLSNVTPPYSAARRCRCRSADPEQDKPPCRDLRRSFASRSPPLAEQPAHESPRWTS